MLGERLWRDERVRTLVLVNLASIMERADEALLPGVYNEISKTLDIGLAALGTLTLLRSITQALCFPLAAYFSLHYDRSKVIATGAFMWSVATFFVGVSSTFTQLAVSRALNGIGLALVIPAIQSIVADASDESNRGLAFGWLQFTHSLGSIVGGFFSILLAETSFLGIQGWRLSFFLVAIISIIVGLLLVFFAVDPVLKTQRTETGLAKIWKGLEEALADGKMVVSIRTFQLIVAQGIAGSFPWAALAFATLWLELKGFTHLQTAVILSFFTVTGSLGSLFGGFMGDLMAKHLPNAGRIIMSQLSSGSGVPITALLLLGLPYTSPSAAAHALVFMLLSFCTSWNGPATNNPIFAEIVPEKSRTSIYALDRSFESVLASFAPPVVGLLAEHLYGYVPPPPSSSSKDTITMNTQNARSLGKALYTAYAIPMSICCVTYTFIYWTYPRDRDNAKRLQLQTQGDSTGAATADVGLSKLAYEKSMNGYFIDEEHGPDSPRDMKKNQDESEDVLLQD